MQEHSRPKKPETQQRRVRAVRHVGSTLRALAAASRPLKMSDLAVKVGVSKTSMYYLLRSLEEERFVARDEDGSFRLSWGLYELGGAVVDSYDLTRVMRSHLDALCEATSEAVVLAILESDTALYLDRSQTDLGFIMLAMPGRRSPLHTSASGKILLAHQSDEFIERVIASGLERRTTKSIIDSADLQAELACVRENGFATCWQEEEVGLNSFAVPIRDFSGEVCAALTVVSPPPRVNPSNLPGLIGVMEQHAVRASERLGDPTRRPVTSHGIRRAV